MKTLNRSLSTFREFCCLLIRLEKREIYFLRKKKKKKLWTGNVLWNCFGHTSGCNKIHPLVIAELWPTLKLEILAEAHYSLQVSLGLEICSGQPQGGSVPTTLCLLKVFRTNFYWDRQCLLILVIMFGNYCDLASWLAQEESHVRFSRSAPLAI